MVNCDWTLFALLHRQGLSSSSLLSCLLYACLSPQYVICKAYVLYVSKFCIIDKNVSIVLNGLLALIGIMYVSNIVIIVHFHFR